MLTSNETKIWLLRYSELESELDHLWGQLEELRGAAQVARISNITGLPHAKGYTSSALDRYAGRLDELEREIAEKRNEAEAVRLEIKGAINKIRGPHYAERTCVLESRYLFCFPWEVVNKIIFGREPDFEDRMDSFLRRTFKIHGAALVALGEILDKEGNYEPE